ncbi:hypothetical protein ABHV50_004235 [Vibrio vulnificus]
MAEFKCHIYFPFGIKKHFYFLGGSDVQNLDCGKSYCIYNLICNRNLNFACTCDVIKTTTTATDKLRNRVEMQKAQPNTNQHNSTQKQRLKHRGLYKIRDREIPGRFNSRNDAIK